MSAQARFRALAAFLLASAAFTAVATPVTVLGPYHFLDNRTSNDAGITPGLVLQFGGTGVSPVAGTMAYAEQGPFTVPNARVVVPLGFTAAANTFAGQCPLSVPNCAAQSGSWALTFRNGADTTLVASPTVSNMTPVPFVSNVTISGTGSQPTFAWALPSGFTPESVAIRIRDNGDRRGGGVADLIYQEYFPGNTTTFQVPAVIPALGVPLSTSNAYSLEIDLVDFRAPAGFIPGSGNTGNRFGVMFSTIERLSRSFLNFTPLSGSVPPNVYLPTPDIQPNGVPAYNFSILNVGGQTIFVDPLIAIGYDYEVGVGNPNFASVTLPGGIGDNFYDLWLWNGTDYVDSGIDLIGGIQFFFGAGGVDRFRILGIELSAGLSPFDATAFVTGLSFVGDGNFTGRMLPIAVQVPEPGSLPLIVLALSLAGLAYRRRYC